ncbi:hypothetical protein B0T19DRAFT_446396 [Cercophora scortea]|uniref:HMG box domain-containing protein n=1 Tax=Cercophora scortea TaxID=314031 RepID=A0AAE0I2U9_9PEZI|nr:hypothetical protein B0T19DRAFT_446396 [Cercophora scortea]
MPTTRAQWRADIKRGPIPEVSADNVQPISQLAEQLNVPAVDVEAYVNRDSATRQHEVHAPWRGPGRPNKAPGKIMRPLNSYMLYRMTYEPCIRDYLKLACKFDNRDINKQTLVSRFSGKSWKRESASVRQRFDELAMIDKANHRLAFPDYKYAPKQYARKESEEHGDDEASVEAEIHVAVGAPDSDSLHVAEAPVDLSIPDISTWLELPPQAADPFQAADVFQAVSVPVTDADPMVFVQNFTGYIPNSYALAGVQGPGHQSSFTVTYPQATNQPQSIPDSNTLPIDPAFDNFQMDVEVGDLSVYPSLGDLQPEVLSSINVDPSLDDIQMDTNADKYEFSIYPSLDDLQTDIGSINIDPSLDDIQIGPTPDDIPMDTDEGDFDFNVYPSLDNIQTDVGDLNIDPSLESISTDNIDAWLANEPTEPSPYPQEPLQFDIAALMTEKTVPREEVHKTLSDHDIEHLRVMDEESQDLATWLWDANWTDMLSV